jgi:hypothetical protein
MKIIFGRNAQEVEKLQTLFNRRRKIMLLCQLSKINGKFSLIGHKKISDKPNYRKKFMLKLAFLLIFEAVLAGSLQYFIGY